MKDSKTQNNELNGRVNVLFPAIVFFVINTIVQYLQQVQNQSFVPLFGFLIEVIIYNLITQTLAYLTCRFFVIKRNKGQKSIWINYIIWIFVMNLGVVSEMISK